MSHARNVLGLLGLVCAALLRGGPLHVGHARAQFPDVVRIGVLTDMSGSTADAAGDGSVAAARLAVQDAGGRLGNARLEVIAGNFQAKPDNALSIAREWFDKENVYAVVDLPYAQASLAVSSLGAQRDRAVMVASAVVSDLTGRACNPVTTHWTDDSYALAYGTARALTRGGKRTWFFLTTDFAYGIAMQRDATAAVLAEGGQVLGAARHPPFTNDMSSFIVQAASSKASVIGLANVGADTVNSIKEANAFGLTDAGQTLAGLLVFINDVHALGLSVSQGLLVTTGYYWDQNDASRRFAERFRAVMGRPPSKSQAAVYAAVRHWIASAEKAGSVSGAAVTAAMKTMPADYFGQSAMVRTDGRVLYDLTLYRVKAPGQSKAPWDYYNQISVLPRADSFRPLAQSECQLVKN